MRAVPSDDGVSTAGRARFASAREDALRGDFEPLQRELGEATSSTLDVARREVASTLRWLAGLEASEPIATELDADASAEVCSLLVEAAARRVTSSLLRFDAASLHALANIARARADRADDPSATLRVELAETWSALVLGSPRPDARIGDLEQEARRLGCADLVVDAAAARALSLAQVGSVDEALACARRACRMGRTEKLPQSEYLAGIALARLRRLTGQPHLATRIAAALRSFAPPPWYAWIDWEMAIACGTSPATVGPAHELQALLHHATAGDRPAFEAACASLHARVGDVAPLSLDVRRLVAALDPDADASTIDDALARWCAGHDAFAAAPHGLAGIDDPQLENPVGGALVVARPGRAGRRVLRAARGLAGARPWPVDGSVGRTEALVSALALLGPEGTDDATLFRCAYGFGYAPALHRGTFDVALHRARAKVEPFGRIVRGGGGVRLEVAHAFVVPDPRSTVGADHRVLGRLARAGQLSARELAAALGIPLRTVQEALHGLVESGCCRPLRDGRMIRYAIEDTTFQEPTLG